MCPPTSPTRRELCGLGAGAAVGGVTVFSAQLSGLQGKIPTWCWRPASGDFGSVPGAAQFPTLGAGPRLVPVFRALKLPVL